MNHTTKNISLEQKKALLQVLQARFEANMSRHEGVDWQAVHAKLEANEAALRSLDAMEQTGGEPDVIGCDANGRYLFCDCAPESPALRRSLCYDRAALDSRKTNKPENSAVDMAADMGIELLTEEEYRSLQALGAFDTKTSSWLATPEDIRRLGGALFGDCRYNRAFIYHNGADSYYAVRGFRGILRV